MNYREWLEKVPEQITGDLLWKVEEYRLGPPDPEITTDPETALADFLTHPAPMP